MSGAKAPDPEYVAARRVLLDVLQALGEHRKAVVLVGAQAIYLHVGEGDFAVAPYTTDGDLAIDPRQLEDEPALTSSLEEAGFELLVRPGTWTLNPTGIQIDFLVPASLGGAGRRGARLGPHGADLARKARGLEAALVDYTLVRVTSLEVSDVRSFNIPVAGLAAMLVAKLHKLHERKDNPVRVQPKDALDVLRILKSEDPNDLRERLALLALDPVARDATCSSRAFLVELFGKRDAFGSLLAAQSLAGLEDEETIVLSCEVLAQRLLQEWK